MPLTRESGGRQKVVESPRVSDPQFRDSTRAIEIGKKWWKKGGESKTIRSQMFEGRQGQAREIWISLETSPRLYKVVK